MVKLGARAWLTLAAFVLQASAFGTTVSFTSSQNWTVPAGVTSITVRALGCRGATVHRTATKVAEVAAVGPLLPRPSR